MIRRPFQYFFGNLEKVPMYSNIRLIWLVVAMASFFVACADGADAPTAKASPGAGAPSSQAINIEFTSDPNPLKSGDNTVEVIVTNADGTPVNDATVAATFYMAAMPSMNMPEMRSLFPLKNEGNGHYRGAGRLVMGGSWDVTVNVTRGNERLATKKLTIMAK